MEPPDELPCQHVGREQLIDVIRSQGARLAEAARLQPTATIQRYAGWSMADLVAHTGSVHRRTLLILSERRQAPVPRQYPDPTTESSVSALLDWFEDGVRRLCDAFETIDPSMRLWSIAEDRTAGFWLVRMALETAVHAADADMARGKRTPLMPDLAVCGIDELARLYLPSLEEVRFEGPHRSVLLVSDERAVRWRFTPSARGALMTRTDDVDADAVVSASASDLYLALTGRIELGELRQSGDPDAVRSLAAAISMIPDAKR